MVTFPGVAVAILLRLQRGRSSAGAVRHQEEVTNASIWVRGDIPCSQGTYLEKLGPGSG